MKMNTFQMSQGGDILVVSGTMILPLAVTYVEPRNGNYVPIQIISQGETSSVIMARMGRVENPKAPKV
jgi:hypothetical protein